ncbi:MAG: HAD-IC family P-type ATPase [Desulfosudis oleivorans]|nr:HAD-IC family P-type ATPase [Desulfosudis oleivorans]
MEAHLLDAADVARQFDVQPATGLSAHEASQRLARDGPNELQTQAPSPAWRHLLAQFQDPLIYLLLLAVVVTLAVWGLEGWVGWPIDAVVILVIVLLNALLGFTQEARSRRAAAALVRLTTATSAVLRDGVPVRIPSTELVRGDVLMLAEGDRVGADARLLQANALRVQQASLTGESEPVPKDPARLAAPTPLADRCNMVFKGTAVAQGSGRAVVTATGMGTEMGVIAHLLEATPEEATPLQKEVRQIGRMLGLAVLVIAAVVVTTVLMVSDIRSTGDVVSVLLLGVSLAVAAVPEGLPAILSLVLAMGVQRMAQRTCDREEAVVGRDPGLGVGDLHRQDRHADPYRDDDRARHDRLWRQPRRRRGLRAAWRRTARDGQPLAGGRLRSEHIVLARRWKPGQQCRR